MLKCFHAVNPRDCDYYPECSKGYIESYKLPNRETRSFTYPGPCILYIHSGVADISCNNFILQNAASPDFILVPEAHFAITSRSPSKIFVFSPDIVKLLADKLQVDYYQTACPAKSKIKPLQLLQSETAIRLSMGILTERLICRQYAEHKFHEIILTIEPDIHKALRTILISKKWFFRIRIGELLKTCGSIEEFAYAMGLSESGFSKAFRRVFGQSFYSWFLERKYDAIVSDMIKTELSFAELAGKHGFYSVQHFGHFIKKRTGISAGKLRQELREGNRDY